MAKQEQTVQSFSFRKFTENGPVIVSNSLSYTMAEYDDNTGLTSWKRVVPASQREHVQEWLLRNYPVKVVAAPVQPRRKQARAA
jgi:hypothetical protein